MDATYARSDSRALWWVVILGAVVLGLLALGNVPDAAIGRHAIERHGEDALYALNAWQAGNCAEVWRDVATNRIVRVVTDGLMGGARHIIITTLAGCPVTAYDASLSYCQRKFRLGRWEYLGTEGWCGD